jgi:hypothetical protein
MLDIYNCSKESYSNIRVHALDGVHDHPRPSIRSKLGYKGIVGIDVVLLHYLRVHGQLDLSTNKISATVGLNDERVCAQLHEGVTSGARHLVTWKGCLVLVDQHLALGLGKCLDSAAIGELDGVEVHL